MLTEQQAIEIYQHKLIFLTKPEYSSASSHSCSLSLRGKSSPLSKFYGVSPRTIRDIWNRQTWGYATNHLWQNDQKIMSTDGCSISSSSEVVL
jgi:hypothetical protein